MSSIYVRNTVKAFLTANSAEKVFDMDGEYETLKDALLAAGIQPRDPWLGIEFIGNDEKGITIPSTNTSGKFRETGAVYFHVVGVAKLGGSGTILARAEALRNKLRAQRMGTLLVDSITPVNFGQGATLSFENGYTSASFLLSYTCDTDL